MMGRHMRLIFPRADLIERICFLEFLVRVIMANWRIGVLV